MQMTSFDRITASSSSIVRRRTPRAEGQTIAAKNFYRPYHRNEVDAGLLKPFSDLKLFTIDEVFGGWQKVQMTHFVEGGAFDRISTKK